MNIIIMIIIAYLLGSIQTGLWIGKYFYQVNLRQHGSGNTGTTNTFRILGVKAGVVTLTIDILKGTLATLIPIILGITTVSPFFIGFFAIIGHIFPIFAQFKGGKAVATSAGVLLGFAPSFFLYLLVIFLLTLYLFSMISLSSITVAVVGILSVLIFPLVGFILTDYDWIFTTVVILMALTIIIRHQDNIKRIRKRQENLVPFGLNLSKQRNK